MRGIVEWALRYGDLDCLLDIYEELIHIIHTEHK